MSKHTPGPWHTDGRVIWSNGESIGFTAIPRDVPRDQAEGESWLDMQKRIKPEIRAAWEEETANARLIAAAPELLEALIDARNELAGLPHSLGYEFTHLRKIDAAIAKARGEA